MLTQAISLGLLCLGVAAFVADSALGPPMLATAIAGWLVMPGRAHAPLVCDPFVLALFDGSIS
jgi:hypothetical protein